mmetsp:Transcript_17555/g.48156  ORF Transcript_17555/g.48156 Transcript_17555/m.48156 type:complete len:209 (+) Transcript_17555:258-884(+)|eukprot:CAMPEP_0117556108 /NCGR_PEP_ID=MMETSP0784-20121206/51630_1 /TAXON_ID=39447 /ORGANISM="" /LENGTH=208 /DNA_ID=CAMNT_0005353355 /DNA_START=165 /DNA_END=791 /DNA_ORIENTATION=-
MAGRGNGGIGVGATGAGIAVTSGDEDEDDEEELLEEEAEYDRRNVSLANTCVGVDGRRPRAGVSTNAVFATARLGAAAASRDAATSLRNLLRQPASNFCVSCFASGKGLAAAMTFLGNAVLHSSLAVTGSLPNSIRIRKSVDLSGTFSSSATNIRAFPSASLSAMAFFACKPTKSGTNFSEVRLAALAAAFFALDSHLPLGPWRSRHN